MRDRLSRHRAFPIGSGYRERFRWWLWRLATRVPWVCPANAHTAIVLDHPGRDRRVRIDRACRTDMARTGTCWCGRLRPAGAPVPDHPAIRAAVLDDDPWGETSG
jgi:hypothetical protein